METPRTPEQAMRQSRYSQELLPQERQALIMTANGDRNSDIAEALNLSERVVECILQRARHRLGATNRTHAVAIAIKRRDITLDDITGSSG